MRSHQSQLAAAQTDFQKMLAHARALIKPLIMSCSALLLAAVLVFGLRAWRRAPAEEYRTFAGPDGRFQIVVYRVPMNFACPGQGSDAPGYLQLRDGRTGRVLRERAVEMVQQVDQIDWSPTNVDVRFLADWNLPK
jgi:hypothetical protein